VSYPHASLGDLDAGTIVRYPRSEGVYNYFAVPSFLIIGAQKCGTRELHTWLSAHPRLRGAPLECHFFNDVMQLEAEWTRYVLSPSFLLSKDRDQALGASLHTFEKTPAYFDQWNRGVPVPALVQRMMPSGKFIALLRDPSERAYSAFQMGRRSQRTEGVFPEYRDSDFESFITRYLKRTHPIHGERLLRIGRYAEHLEVWNQVFSQEQILVVLLEEFTQDPPRVMQRVLRFLGLPDLDYRPLMERNHRGLWVLKGQPSKGNASPYPPLSDPARAMLDQYYAPHNERLSRLLPALSLPWG